MSLRIRMSRGGAKKRPYYHIVIADARSPRDGRYIERVGSYNPMVAKDHPDRIKLLDERIKYWLGVGAQPSDRVARFLGAAGIIEKRAIPVQTKQNLPRAKTLERMKEAEEAAKAKAESAAAAKVEDEAAAAKAEEEAAAAAKAKEEAAAEAAKAKEEAAAEAAKAAESKAEEAPAEEAKTEEAPAEEAKTEEAPAEEEKSGEEKSGQKKAGEEKPEEEKAAN